MRLLLPRIHEQRVRLPSTELSVNFSMAAEMNFNDVLQQLHARIIGLEQQVQQAHQPALPPHNTRPPKPDFFSGESKDRLYVRDWAYSVTTFFEASNMVGESVRISYAKTLLRQHALRWWRSLVPAPTTWADFQDQLVRYFQPLGADQAARNQLDRLSQRGSVADYSDRFRAITDMIPQMSDPEKRSSFVRGLKDPVKLQVAFANPETFEETIILATKIDDILFHYGATGSRERSLRRPPPHTPYTTNKSSAPPSYMELGAIPSNQSYASAVAFGSNPRLTKLTDEERERLRKIGACFKCRQTGHNAAQCPMRNPGNGQHRQ